jgi:hypothetical protein
MEVSRKILLIFLFQLLLVFSAENAFSQEDVFKMYEYLSPIPFSVYHNPETAILVRYGAKIDISSLKNELLQASGSISGKHKGKITVSQDQRTIIFKPDQAFSFDEEVSFHLGEGIQTQSGKFLPPFDFWFTIRQKPDTDLLTGLTEDLNGTINLMKKSDYSVSLKGSPLSFLDFKFPEITFSDNPSPGNILTTLIENVSNYIYVFDNNAVPKYARLMPHTISDLKPQPSGRITYYDGFIKGFVALDPTLNAIDTFAMKNGYKTDSHEILLLNSGNIILFSYDPRIVDMSKVVAGGNPAATVTGLVIQELDANRNLVFQWRSWDHFNISDSYSDLLSSVVDYVHGNSIDADTDSTLIISSRNMNEVTKINRLTGQIIWRLGGKNNEFIFENDPRHFAGQHSAIKQKNGNLTLFDNGLGLDPQYSRGIEYEMDETGKKVKLVHEYRHVPDVFANISGNLQRLDDGNTFIFWGPAIDHSKQFIDEFNQTGNLIFEAKFDSTIYPTYRVYRSLWEPKSFTFSTDTLTFTQPIQNAPVYHKIAINNNSNREIIITSAHNKNLGFYVNDLPLTIEAGSEDSCTVVFPSFTVGKISDNIIFCQETDSTLVTRSLFVSVNNVLGTGIENHFQSDFKVGPNPGKGEFFIEVNTPGKFSIKVFDLYGKIVWKSDREESENFQIDLSNKPNGIYVLYIEDLGTGMIRAVKLIKQE